MENTVSVSKVEQAALNVRVNIKPSYLQFRYKSVPGRMEAVVDANKGHCKY